MTFSLFQYLLESSLCLLALSLFYQLCLARTTHFVWMRHYLLASILLSILLPFLVTAFQPLVNRIATEPGSLPSLNWDTSRWLAVDYNPSQKNTFTPSLSWLGYFILLLYGSGMGFRMWIFGKSLLKIRRLIHQNHKVKEDNYWVVYVSEPQPAFSFLHYIFIGKGTDRLPSHELQQIKEHELVHVRQKHSLDLLLIELTAVFFWFNPLIFYLKRRLQEVHEYLADDAVAGRGKQQKAYALLLLKLSAPARSISLATSFSNKQIHNRIMMLMKTRTLAHKKLYFLLLLPLIASLLFLFSCMEESQEDVQSVVNGELNEPSSTTSTLENGKKIASIRWEGNTIYDDEKLNETLGLKAGDMYNEEIVNSRLNYNPTLGDISSLYMDNGYIFYNVEVSEQKNADGTFNLNFQLYEGQKVKVDKITIKGNQKVSEREISAQIPLKSGDVFSRADFIASQKAIAEMGFFDPEKININPIPYPEKGTVDIEFVLTEMQAEN